MTHLNKEQCKRLRTEQNMRWFGGSLKLHCLKSVPEYFHFSSPEGPRNAHKTLDIE